MATVLLRQVTEARGSPTPAARREIRFAPVPAPGLAEGVGQELLCIASNRCGLVLPEGAAAPIEVRVTEAALLLSAESAALCRTTALTPALVVQRLGSQRVGLRGVWPAPDLDLLLAEPAEAAELAGTLEAAIEAVAQSLFVGLLRPTPEPGAPVEGPQPAELPASAGTPVARAPVLYTPPAPTASSSLANSGAPPTFELRHCELCLAPAPAGPLPHSLRVYADASRAELVQVLALGPCSIVLHSPGSTSVAVKERQLHRLAFCSARAASLWAELLGAAAAAASALGWEATAGCRDGILLRAGVAEAAASEPPPAAAPPLLGAARTMFGKETPCQLEAPKVRPAERFDVLAALERQEAAVSLPEGSETCRVQAQAARPAERFDVVEVLARQANSETTTALPETTETCRAQALQSLSAANAGLRGSLAAVADGTMLPKWAATSRQR